MPAVLVMPSANLRYPDIRHLAAVVASKEEPVLATPKALIVNDAHLRRLLAPVPAAVVRDVMGEEPYPDVPNATGGLSRSRFSTGFIVTTEGRRDVRMEKAAITPVRTRAIVVADRVSPGRMLFDLMYCGRLPLRPSKSATCWCGSPGPSKQHTSPAFASESAISPAQTALTCQTCSTLSPNDRAAAPSLR
jgi:hypothetical protein